MHKLKSIEIRGFRGQESPIRLNLKEDANFIIGRNGTGKTTLINLISAALSVDLPALREGRFQSIELKFRTSGSRQVPTVYIYKEGESGSEEILYQVQESSSSSPDVYPMYRRRRAVTSSDGTRRTMLSPAPVRPLKERLASIYKSTWLSLQRTQRQQEIDEFEVEEEGVSDVDRKLDQVFNDLVRYFSRLDRQVADQTQLFQKRWFLSFLASDRVFKPTQVYKFDINDERTSLVSIFEKFNMDPESYQDQLDRHFTLLERSKRLYHDHPSFQFKDMLVMYDTARLHTLVEQWQTLQDAQVEIYMPKTEYVNIASDLLFRKQVLVNRSNQVVITTDEGQVIPQGKLSSGEKQLLIFLSETLLQEQDPYIFLADEPELSLHVEWQEDLVPSLLKVNPNAQVLFATHSPDIVNVFQKNVFEMEKMID